MRPRPTVNLASEWIIMEGVGSWVGLPEGDSRLASAEGYAGVEERSATVILALRRASNLS